MTKRKNRVESIIKPRNIQYFINELVHYIRKEYQQKKNPFVFHFNKSLYNLQYEN